MKLAASFSLLAAAALLAACAYEGPAMSSTSAPGKHPELVAQPMPYKAGTGVVQSWAAAPGSAAAGASGRVDPAPGEGLLRLAIKMDSGGVVYVDTDSRDFPVGTRVQLTEDHVIRRP